MVDESATKPEPKSVLVNTDIWNNQVVVQMTGLTVEMLSKVLFSMAEFIKINLMPNHLEYFNLENLKGVQNIKQK